MGNLTSTDMAIVLILVAIIFILIGIITYIDYLNKRKKENLEFDPEHANYDYGFGPDDDWLIREKVKEHRRALATGEEERTVEMPVDEIVEAYTEELNKEENQVEVAPVVDTKENSSKVEEIKYVEEDEELERTNAKLELEQLKVELQYQEEQKKKEEALKRQEEEQKALENQVEVVEEEKANEVVVEQEEHQPEKVTEVTEIADMISEELTVNDKVDSNLEKASKIQEDLKEVLENNIDLEIAHHEDEQEEKAIISVDALNKITEDLYSQNEERQSQYMDEGNEPISLTELETLYNTREMKAIKLDDFETIKEPEKQEILADADIKSLEELPPISMEKKFKSTPFISPVYGISETKESIELEQTANLDKLNEEIKKTNEFLKTLKELQKHLD